MSHWLIFLYIVLCVWLYITHKSILEIHDSIPFVNETGIFKSTDFERNEQLLADMYIEPGDNVLELGTRYGTVSCIICRKADNLVTVDPDIEALEYAYINMNNHKLSFNIVHGIVSTIKQTVNKDGYATTTVEDTSSNIPNFTIDDLEKKFKIKFNAIVADCEGCLEHVLKTNSLKNVKKIIYEADREDKCNYNVVDEILKTNGFECLYNKGNQRVWFKK